jgi:2-oxoglutarate-Fe(II)-dependent dioxygenase family protein
MSDDSARRSADGIEKVQADLRNQGYALTTDRAIGLPAGQREHFFSRYCNSDTLRHDEGDFPVDRERARDVVRYSWSHSSLGLREHDRITITNRAGIKGEREHTRVHLLEDPEAEQLISTLLQLVPPERRQADGTFGINLLRTFTNVVTTPHHDDEEYIIIYVLDRIGDGAETSIYYAADVDEDGDILGKPVLTQQLNPGDVFIFDDKAFLHDTTPLMSPPGGSARRDVLVCTVDYRSTYLEPVVA